MIQGFVTGVIITVLLFTALYILYTSTVDNTKNIQSEYKTAINNKYVDMARAENFAYKVASERISEFTPSIYDAKQIRPERIVINDFDGSDVSNWVIEYKIVDKKTIPDDNTEKETTKINEDKNS